MENYSIILAIVDFVPVLFFLLAAIKLLKGFKDFFNSVTDVLFKSGFMMIFLAGLLKAVWKMFAALGVFDFYPLNVMFLPVQAVGFIFVGVSLISLLVSTKNKVFTEVILSASLTLLPAYGGSVIFLVLMTLGQTLITISLCVLAGRKGLKSCIILFVVSFVCAMSMGGMSAIEKMLSVTAANWVEEIINSVGQVSLFVGSCLLTKKK